MTNLVLLILHNDQPMTETNQQKIATEVGLTQGAIANKIKEIEQKIKDLLDNPKSEKLIKFDFLDENTSKILEFSPFLYNIWNKLS